MRCRQRWTILAWALPGLVFAVPRVLAQGVDVSATVLLRQVPETVADRHKGHPLAVEVVVWLTPLKPSASPARDAAHPGPFRLVQKDKQFTPHLLVVPTGTSVEFPNKDPFFHNVFSLFNGKRFDLGLYESGSSRSVRFDREGISYIFCNIHPEMGAIVVSISTPYYGLASAGGVVTIHNVPAGTYQLHAWSETSKPADLADVPRLVQVASSPVHLEEVVVQEKIDPIKHHKNKFGDDYRPGHDPTY